MAATNPTYDLILMLDTAVPDEQRAKVRVEVERVIAGGGGTLVGQQDWGPRATAYEIRHKTDAEYHLLQFHSTPEILSTLQRMLRIADEVVRFRIIKLAPGTPAPPETRPEPRPNAVGAPAEAVPAAFEAAPVAVAEPAPAEPVEPAPAAEPTP